MEAPSRRGGTVCDEMESGRLDKGSAGDGGGRCSPARAKGEAAIQTAGLGLAPGLEL